MRRGQKREIEVYKVDGEYEFTNVRLSWRATISKEMYDNLTIEGAGVECSIEGKNSHNIECSDNIGLDDNGNYYILGSLSIPASQVSTVITAKAYFIVDGEKLYLNSTSYSLESAIKAYLTISSSLTKEQQEALNALAKYYGINV